MALGDVTLLAPISIQGDDTKVIARAKSIGNGFAVCDTTARNLISSEAKLGGFAVYNTTTSQLEYWNGSAWVAIGGAGGIAGIPMTFFASTVDGDPGAGGIRLSHATPASATSLYVDDVESEDGTNIRDLLAALGTYVGATVTLRSKTANDNWIVYKVGGYTGASGYSKLTSLTVVDSSTTVTLSTTVGDTILSIDIGVPKDLDNQGLTNVRGIGFAGEINNTGATPTIDFTTGDLQKITANANCAPTLVAPSGVRWVQVCFIQDSTPRTLTFPGSVLGSPPQPSVVSGSRTFYPLFYDGTNYHYVAGTALSSGGGMGFRMGYSATTTDADPGAATLRASTASYASAGSYSLYIDLTEYGGTDITAWLDSFDDTNGGVKGILRLQSLSDPTKWVEVVVTGWTTATGYRKLAVTYLAGPGGLTTTAGDTFLSFDALGYTGTIATANIAAGAVTGPKLSAPAATGAQLLYDGTQWLHVGTTSAILADASVTIQFGTASQYIWPSTVDSASPRNLTFGNTGLAAGPMAGQAAVMTILFMRANYTSAIAVKNIAGTTIFTVPASLGKPLVARFYYDVGAADWALAGWDYLSVATAA